MEEKIRKWDPIGKMVETGKSKSDGRIWSKKVHYFEKAFEAMSLWKFLKHLGCGKMLYSLNTLTHKHGGKD